MAKILDSVDLKILKELQSDCRINNKALAEKIGLSESPCSRRVKQLEDGGVIQRYVALVDPQKIGCGFSAFVRVELNRGSAKNINNFENKVKTFPEVVECYRMTGDYDYLLRVMVADTDGFDNFIQKKLTAVSSISRTNTNISLSRVIYKTALPTLMDNK